MDEILNLGTTEDRQSRLEKPRVDSAEYRTLVKDAQKKLYNEGYAVDGERVDELLKGKSLVPTEVGTRVCAPLKCIPNNKGPQNAFSLALGKFGLDVFKILTVDILHEVELGVGKGVTLHLVRMLETVAPHQVHIVEQARGIFYTTQDTLLLTYKGEGSLLVVEGREKRMIIFHGGHRYIYIIA